MRWASATESGKSTGDKSDRFIVMPECRAWRAMTIIIQPSGAESLIIPWNGEVPRCVTAVLSPGKQEGGGQLERFGAFLPLITIPETGFELPRCRIGGHISDNPRTATQDKFQAWCRRHGRYLLSLALIFRKADARHPR